jgi:tRNA-dihydrouridine synthase
VVAQTGCDAVMIGRMAPANPWIFRQIEQYRSSIEQRRTSADSGFVSGYRFSDIASSTESIAPLGAAGHDLSRENDRVGDDSSLESDRAGHDFSRAEYNAPSTALAAEGAVSAANKLYDAPTESDRYQMIRTYFQMLLEEEMPGAEGKMKQFASWFTHGIPGGAALRKTIYDAKSGAEILTRVEEFFEARLSATSV